MRNVRGRQKRCDTKDLKEWNTCGPSSSSLGGRHGWPSRRLPVLPPLSSLNTLGRRTLRFAPPSLDLSMFQTSYLVPQNINLFMIPCSGRTGSCFILESSRSVPGSLRRSFLLPTRMIGTLGQKWRTLNQIFHRFIAFATSCNGSVCLFGPRSPGKRPNPQHTKRVRTKEKAQSGRGNE